MIENPQKYLADILDDELWSALTPAQQLDLCATTRASAQANLTKIKETLADRDLATTGHERAELHARRSSTIRFIDTLDKRVMKAKQAQTEKNIEAANTKNGRDRNRLVEAIQAHRAVTEANSTEQMLVDADTALYEVLEEVME